MKRSDLAKTIYKHSYITGDFLLRSGKRSNEYFDKYRFASNPMILDAISDEMMSMVPSDTDYLAALEMGGIPIAIAISLKLGIPVVFVRKQTKEYGTCNLAEGGDIKGKKLLIVEDVVTSGGQIIISTGELRLLGANITNAICVIDRLSGGEATLNNIGVTLNSLFTIDELKAI